MITNTIFIAIWLHSANVERERCPLIKVSLSLLLHNPQCKQLSEIQFKMTRFSLHSAKDMCQLLKQQQSRLD